MYYIMKRRWCRNNGFAKTGQTGCHKIHIVHTRTRDHSHYAIIKSRPSRRGDNGRGEETRLRILYCCCGRIEEETLKKKKTK